MSTVLAYVHLERALQLGTLFSVDEAYKIGLIDNVAPDLQNATSVAEAELKEFIQIPSNLYIELIFKK